MTIFIQAQKQKKLSMKMKPLGKGSGWIIYSVIDHTINISKYNPLPGGSKHIKL